MMKLSQKRPARYPAVCAGHREGVEGMVMLLKRLFGGQGRSVLSCLTALAMALSGVLVVPGWVQAAEAVQGVGTVPLAVGEPANAAVGNWKTSQEIGKVGARQEVPILMYHNLCEDPDSPEISQNTISRRQFEEEMKLLVSMGRNTVTFDQMIDYVEKGTPLPKNPVCITFDDGYLSNYQIAFPILKKYRMKATVFLIGSTVGNTEHYKDTEFPITPHMDYEQAKEMSDSGLVSIQTHTYDMHQWAAYETGDKIRPNILKLANETEEEYAAALEDDFSRSREEIEAATGKPVRVLAYPGGAFDARSQKLLESFGVEATLSIDPGKTVLIRGVPKSLRAMNRFYVVPGTTAETFRRWVG